MSGAGTRSTHDKLVYMANQIAKFFGSQPEDEAIAGAADHLRKFWDPRMRAKIIAHLDGGGAGLDPLASKAIARLKTLQRDPP